MIAHVGHHAQGAHKGRPYDGPPTGLIQHPPGFPTLREWGAKVHCEIPTLVSALRERESASQELEDDPGEFVWVFMSHHVSGVRHHM